MKLTLSDVAGRIEAVLAGTFPRLDADHWFIEMMDCEGRGGLVFDPADDEDRIRQALRCLQALDLSDSAGNYLISASELQAALEGMRAAWSS